MSATIEWYEAVALGGVEGLTEFLPISSTGHLTVLERAFGLPIAAGDVTAFTALIQIGAVVATLLFFRKDFDDLTRALAAGLRHPGRRTDADFRFGMAVLLGSLPIAVVGLVFKDVIETTLRSLWVVGGALVLWSFVMLYADRHAREDRHEAEVTRRDTLFMGAAQCLALIPGVSRSGATVAAGLTTGLDRVTVVRLSFFLSVPALSAAGVLQLVTKSDDISAGVGWGPTLLATGVAFGVAYLAVAWLLRFVAHHSFARFIAYRLVLGCAVLALTASGVLSAR